MKYPQKVNVIQAENILEVDGMGAGLSMSTGILRVWWKCLHQSVNLPKIKNCTLKTSKLHDM